MLFDQVSSADHTTQEALPGLSAPAQKEHDAEQRKREF